MLTGAPTFARPTPTDTISAVVSVDPDWAHCLPTRRPPSLGYSHVVSRKTRGDDFTTSPTEVELEEAMTAPALAVPARRRWTRPATWALSLGLVAAVAAAWLARDRFGRPSEPPPDTRVMRLTDLPGLEEFPAISPDGRSVAFTAGVGGTRQLFMKLITGGAPLQLTRDSVDHGYPRWSPDSSSIFYFSPAAPGQLQGNIWEIPALGGVPRRVVSSVGGADVSPTDGRLAHFRLAKESSWSPRQQTDPVRRGRRVRGCHLLLVSTVVA